MKKWCYIKVSPGMKAKIDQEDLGRVSQHSWRAVRSTTGRYKVITSLRTPKGVRSMTLGRFLITPPKGKQIYPRRFQEGLDYRKSNLVVCTVQERQRLLPKRRSKTSSQYRGVSYSKTDKRWKAGIEIDGVGINLGHFKSEEEAALTYNRAAKKHFGEMAYQNQIKKKPKRKYDLKKK
jgi:hypothetical protein